VKTYLQKEGKGDGPQRTTKKQKTKEKNGSPVNFPKRKTFYKERKKNKTTQTKQNTTNSARQENPFCAAIGRKGEMDQGGRN